jgi:hypothetical protein
MQSSQTPKELVQGILWINQGPPETTEELITRIQREVPLAEINQLEGEVTLLILAVPETKVNKGAALIQKDQQLCQCQTAVEMGTVRCCPL